MKVRVSERKKEVCFGHTDRQTVRETDPFPFLVSFLWRCGNTCKTVLRLLTDGLKGTV